MSDTETLIAAAVLLYLWSQPSKSDCRCAPALSSTAGADQFGIVASSDDEVPAGYATDAEGYLVEVDIGAGDTLDSILVRQKG
jgi:hypothetical protein